MALGNKQHDIYIYIGRPRSLIRTNLGHAISHVCLTNESPVNVAKFVTGLYSVYVSYYSITKTGSSLVGTFFAVSSAFMSRDMHILVLDLIRGYCWIRVR